MAAPNYDEMADEAEVEDVEELDAEEPELDDELVMLAEELGFTGAKAETFKRFVERCVELKDGGGYAEEPLDAALEEPLV